MIRTTGWHLILEVYKEEHLFVTSSGFVFTFQRQIDYTLLKYETITP